MTLGEFSKVFHVSQLVRVTALNPGTFDTIFFICILGTELNGGITHIKNCLKDKQHWEVEKVDDDINGFLTIWLKPQDAKENEK